MKLTVDNLSETIHADGGYCEPGGTPEGCTGACRRAAEVVAQMWPTAFDKAAEA